MDTNVEHIENGINSQNDNNNHFERKESFCHNFFAIN